MTKLTPTELAKEAEKIYYRETCALSVPPWENPESNEESAWLAVGEWIHTLVKPVPAKEHETVAVQHMCDKDGKCAGCGGPTKLVFSVGEVRMRACCKQCAVKAIKERM